MRPATASIPVSRATGGVSVVVPVVTVEGGSAQTVIANARNILATQQQQNTSSSSGSPSTSANSATAYNDSANADLIRQLNVARAQGDVVLQHWGDKQVLVHKAIQGDRTAQTHNFRRNFFLFCHSLTKMILEILIFSSLKNGKF